jgi:hypothetical protein
MCPKPSNVDAVTLLKNGNFFYCRENAKLPACGTYVWLKLYAIRAPKRQNIDSLT